MPSYISRIGWRSQIKSISYSKQVWQVKTINCFLNRDSCITTALKTTEMWVYDGQGFFYRLILTGHLFVWKEWGTDLWSCEGADSWQASPISWDVSSTAAVSLMGFFVSNSLSAFCSTGSMYADEFDDAISGCWESSGTWRTCASSKRQLQKHNIRLKE